LFPFPQKITEEAAAAAKVNSEAITSATGPNTSTQAASANEEDDKDKEDDKDAKKKKNRCGECRKKVGLTGMFSVLESNYLLTKCIFVSYRFPVSLRRSVLRRASLF